MSGKRRRIYISNFPGGKKRKKKKEGQVRALNTPGAQHVTLNSLLHDFTCLGIKVIGFHSKPQICAEYYFNVPFKWFLFSAACTVCRIQGMSQWDTFGKLQTLNAFEAAACCHRGPAAEPCQGHCELGHYRSRCIIVSQIYRGEVRRFGKSFPK